jgi:serine phosphatase RsbU (regulator of sigma subunit)
MYGEAGKYDSAMMFLNVALPAFKEQQYTYAEGMTYALIGQMKDSQKDYKGSLESLDQAMKLFKEIGQLYGIGVGYQAIGKTYEDMGDKKKALENYLAAYDIHLKRNAYDNLKEVCNHIASIYKAQGDYENALAYHEKYMDYKDSVFNEKSRKQLLELDTKFQTESKEKEIALKNLELEKTNSEVKSKNIFIYVFAGVSLVFLVMGFFVWRQYRAKKLAAHKVMLQKNIIEEKNKSIMDSIRYAQFIQQSIMPDEDMTYQLLRESFILYKPKDVVSGDFYWIVAVGDYTYIAAVDCTGHGVPGAFMSMVGHNALSNAIKHNEFPGTGKVLSQLQREVKDLFLHNYNSSNIRDGMDIALVRLDRKNMKLMFSGANNPVCIARNGQVYEYRGDKTSISAHRDHSFIRFTEHELDLQKGDAFYLFSDGYADQFGGPKGKKFKYKNLIELLKKNSSLPMFEQKQVFAKTIQDWKGDLEQIDDILLMGIRI